MYLVTHQADGLARGTIRRVGWNDRQPNDAALRAADETDCVLQRHIHDVHRFFSVLGNRYDSVTDLKQLAPGCRTARHEFPDLAVSVLWLKCGADADQR